MIPAKTTDPRYFPKNMFKHLSKKSFSRYDFETDPKKIQQEKY